MNNPGIHESVGTIAMINIFVASLLLGSVVIRTRSVLPCIALHFLANWIQGILLGFGVSGHLENGILPPVSDDAPKWLAGGDVGLEGSLPGTVTLFEVRILITGPVNCI